MAPQPWYRRAHRWGQLNLVEYDPVALDLERVADYWRRTAVDGVIINAGGIVAYYPSAVEHHYRAEHLGDRDLFGELTELARSMDLAVLARMDSNRALPDCYAAHPDWFACNHEGHPCYTGERERSSGTDSCRYMACINGAYYHDYLPRILREICDRYQPDGFTDNSWTGTPPSYVCHCQACQDGFAAVSKEPLPVQADWADPVYRRWYRWSIDCRTALWRHNQQVCRAAGGDDCLWMGMIHADPIRSHVKFADLYELLQDQPAVMCDHQSRNQLIGFEQNATNGAVLHDLAGWDALIPESMACYVRSGGRTFRQTRAEPAEAQAWMRSGIAGGLSPWWHHVGVVANDQRQFDTATEIFTWHRDHEDALVAREPLVDIGVAWSQDHIYFGGRDDANERVELPWHGWTRALTRDGLSWRPLHSRRIAEGAPDVLILPDLAAMRDDEIQAVRAHVASGGSLIASGLSGRWDRDGEERADWPLAELFGIASTGGSYGIGGTYNLDWEHHQRHNYLALADSDHEILAPLVGSDRIGLGGTVQGVRIVADDALGLTHLIPAYPLYPPEFAWPRGEHPDVPGIVVRQHPAGGRIVYLAADIDRAYGRSGLPDHGNLLAACARWALGRAPTIQRQGPGRVDMRCYRQRTDDGERLLVHLVNHTHSNGNDCREDTIPVGPVKVRTTLQMANAGRCLVTGNTVPIDESGAFTVDLLAEHALIAVPLEA